MYWSTVHSVNLTRRLLSVRQVLLAEADAPLLPPATWQGLRDTLALLEEAGGATPEAFRTRLDALPVSPPPGCGEALQALAELAAMAQPSSGADPARALEEALDDATYWAGTLFDQSRPAAAPLAWHPPSLAADPVPTPRDPVRKGVPSGKS